MRVAILTGIYPPDIGGPATHARDLKAGFEAFGHEVTVLTLWDGRDVRVDDGIVRFPRGWPWPFRAARIAGWLVSHAGQLDAVYATGLHVEAVAGARAARLPVSIKIVGDPVWERAKRLGLTSAGFEEYRAAPPPTDRRTRLWRGLRDWSLHHADAVMTPSAYLATVVEGWLGGPADVTVIPNGVRIPDGAGSDRPAPLEGSPRLIYVGRLVRHKRVERLIDAVSSTDDWSLEVVGSGPEREALEAHAASSSSRVTFLGDLPHDEVLARVAAADALGLASDYEGLPHVVLEALAVGTPVLSPPVGGVPEVVTDGLDGRIVPNGTVEELAAALAVLSDAGLRERLREGARRAGADHRIEHVAERVLETIERTSRGKPRVVFVGKNRVPVPTGPGAAPAVDARRWEVLVRHTRPVVVGVGRPGHRWAGRVEVFAFPDRRPRAASSALFYAMAPLVGVARSLGSGPSGIVCQSPYEGAGVIALSRLVPARRRAKVVVEVHGDWRATTRLYGSRARSFAAPAADAIAAWALRNAAQVRVISGFTERLVLDAGFRGAVDRYTAYGDLESFLEPEPMPLPAVPRALYVGALEPTKGVDVLLEAWRLVVEMVPGAELTVVGAGSQRDALVRQTQLAGLEGAVHFEGPVSREEVQAAMDRSTTLVLPSRSEGLGRVILEASARGRPSIGTKTGGIVEVIDDGDTGTLVDIDEPQALGKAIVDLLSDPDRAARMGMAARVAVERRDPSERFEEGIRRLAELVQPR